MPTDAELLTTLSRMDSVEAIAVGDGDHRECNVSDWCEILLDLEYPGGARRRLEMTRHDAELIIEVLHQVLHPHEHKSSPVQKLWSLLDDQMDFLLADDDPEPEDKVRAKTLAEAIVLCTNPLADPEHIDVSDVRAQAVERWEERP